MTASKTAPMAALAGALAASACAAIGADNTNRDESVISGELTYPP